MKEGVPMSLDLRTQIRKIVSGGQTGADRAALDWAIRNRIAHGGWCPFGRRAEDGPLDAKYQLFETASARYSRRTRLNVEDSDGTLVVNLGALDGGTLLTLEIAQRWSKPHILLQLDSEPVEEAGQRLWDWLEAEEVTTLNVAGPRESKRPGTYNLTYRLLDGPYRGADC
jgi:hypothetical protein